MGSSKLMKGTIKTTKNRKYDTNAKWVMKVTVIIDHIRPKEPVRVSKTIAEITMTIPVPKSVLFAQDIEYATDKERCIPTIEPDLQEKPWSEICETFFANVFPALYNDEESALNLSLHFEFNEWTLTKQPVLTVYNHCTDICTGLRELMDYYENKSYLTVLADKFFYLERIRQINSVVVRLATDKIEPRLLGWEDVTHEAVGIKEIHEFFELTDKKIE